MRQRLGIFSSGIRRVIFNDTSYKPASGQSRENEYASNRAILAAERTGLSHAKDRLLGREASDYHGGIVKRGHCAGGLFEYFENRHPILIVIAARDRQKATFLAAQSMKYRGFFTNFDQAIVKVARPFLDKAVGQGPADDPAVIGNLFGVCRLHKSCNFKQDIPHQTYCSTGTIQISIRPEFGSSRILALPSQIDDDCFCLDFFSGAIP
ncbi:hypothetical protein GOZ90_02730 [Agrobacterium vitis]|uniref:Uncharacterized protein n=1 Tax=Agrobacterium vitis TaxID=373 RepID=A0A6L6V774_AGRVI|nr:hypothetical protein [Agrobacterium vitis]MUZ71584.1 hypothetical protein [Agrobacterium vitis]